MQPYYYCPKCDMRVLHIVEVYHTITEDREWDGECYELVESSLSMEEPNIILCGICNSKVMEMEGDK